MVVDNASAPPVVELLESELEAGRIDYLVRNRRNLGVQNGQLQILRGAPGDQVVFADGDIYFRPGWLSALTDVMDAFPGLGLVGGYPRRKHTGRWTTSTFAWIDDNRADLEVETGSLIPAEWERDFARSTGNDGEATPPESTGPPDCRITRGGVSAFVGAGHMVYAMSREAIGRLPHIRHDHPMGIPLDDAVDEVGLLRLSTSRPVVYHIGNEIGEPWLMEEYERLVGGSVAAPAARGTNGRHWFWGSTRVRRVVKAVHSYSFKKLTG
jgi:hypothetical protein